MKRKLNNEDMDGARKKNGKEVVPTSLSSRKKNKKSFGQLDRKVTWVDQKGNNGGGDGDLSGVSVRLNGGVNIPKRPRDLVLRKKVGVDCAVEHGRGSGSRGNSSDESVKRSGIGAGSLHYMNNGAGIHHNGNGILTHNGESEGVLSDGVVGKLNRKKHSDDHNESRSNNCAVAQRLKREKSDVFLHDIDSLLKEAKKLRKVVKETRLAASTVSKKVKELAKSSRIVDAIQDDEGNLEETATRMLSSHFDPSRSRFSSGGNIPRLPLINGLSTTTFLNSNLDITHTISLAKSTIASSDGETMAFRPTVQPKRKSKRQFYEVLCRDFDPYSLINRRIQVFWPDVQKWIPGHVARYVREKQKHHVDYDDGDREVLDLRSERFKLFLLPNEVPGKVGQRRSSAPDKQLGKGKNVETADKEQNSNSYMEFEPIIPRPGDSTLHKSPPVEVRKRQRSPHESEKSSLPLACKRKSKLMETSEVKSSKGDVDNFACGFDEPNNLHVSKKERKFHEQRVCSYYNRDFIVYYRRRFQKISQQPSKIHVPDLCQSSKTPLCDSASESVDSLDFGLDMLLSMAECCCHFKSMCSNEFIWDADASGCLKLIIPVTNLKVIRCELCLPVPFVDNNLFRGRSYLFLHQRSDLISVSSMVRLEILFVDNTVGLRFLLFEGCLMQAISFVFLVLVVFQSNQEEENYSGQQLPVTSIGFRISSLRSWRKRLLFTFYKFTEIGCSKWSYLHRRLRLHCASPNSCLYLNPPMMTS